MSDDNELKHLLELAKGSITVKPIRFAPGKQILRFISEKNITSGKTRVHTPIIYASYIEWCREKKIKNRLPKTLFFSQFGRLFTKYRTKNRNYYLLEGSSFEVTYAEFLRAKEICAKEKERQKKLKTENGFDKKEISSGDN